MHFYNFNIGDYKSHTSHLTPIEDICYRRLLDYYYLHEKPLENDIEKLCRVLMLNGCSTDVERTLNEFFLLHENHWYNERADYEISAYKAKVQKSVEAGKASGRARSERTLNGRSTDVEPNKKQETRNNIKTSSSLSSGDDEKNEDDFKKVPPRKPEKDLIPYGDIVNLFNEICVGLPSVQTFPDSRKSLLRARWNENVKRQSLDYWRKYFTYVQACDHLAGRTEPREGKRVWVATFDWILNATNFAKIIEGNYANR